ncbi:membrane protein insertion efficiency factor YidD [Candidatus Gottesmanbacteria bacterium RIFCSPHIGHO2_02_FULL_39_11]|uniref:Putative membrane protein insertion efficiency factor n=1 Tax=Candidatus Gottesmanbacteria bacterium RIFCSPHIGHO2_02_FULL_39_11 TaxID=1798382 RepID=A0A1F5ZT56_9BACT|nr:MAG: membrane protein insertion efficiency factor YidD [Candidatus Gottesmanbacteria bacterium RIFCSPHIGHO2_02_FULL_39_11]
MSKNFVLYLIKFYKKSGTASAISVLFGSTCRFTPTCSDYTYEAVNRYGTIRGLFMGAKRLARCHPFNKAGIDPVR